MKEKKIVVVIIACFLAVLLAMAFVLNGTGDSGDSIYHFLFTRYAFLHPENFYDTWAKPLYVLLGAPFAQAGFTGIKIFNILNIVLAAFAAYMVARRLEIDNAWLVTILLILAPLNFALALTGLTEPLFACLLICGLCLVFYEKPLTGAVVLSFLPFVRSEGLFILIIMGIYFVLQKKYLPVILLAAGQVIYAIAGYFHFKSFFWFYANNPYTITGRYGHGEWLDYFRKLPIIIGPASCLLLAVGFVFIPILLIKGRGTKNNYKAASGQKLVVWTIFSAYFFFHVIAWKFGLFASFGETRIIVAVTPLIALISLDGYNKVLSLGKGLNFTPGKMLAFTAILAITINLVYMLVSFCGPVGTDGLQLTLSTDQLIESKMADYIKQKYPDYKNKMIFYQATYISLALNTDPFDTTKHSIIMYKDDVIPSQSLFIWDDWYSVVEGGVPLDYLQHNIKWIRDTSFHTMDASSGNERAVILFRKK